LYMGWGIWTPNMSCIWTEITNICRASTWSKSKFPGYARGVSRFQFDSIVHKGEGVATLTANLRLSVMKPICQRPLRHNNNPHVFLPNIWWNFNMAAWWNIEMIWTQHEQHYTSILTPLLIVFLILGLLFISAIINFIHKCHQHIYTVTVEVTVKCIVSINNLQ
jgi:hypothetical protein